MNPRLKWLWPLWLAALMIFPAPSVGEEDLAGEKARHMILFNEAFGIDNQLFTDLDLTYEPLDRIDIIDMVVIDLYPEEVDRIKEDVRVSDVTLDEPISTDEHWTNSGFDQINAQSVLANDLSGAGIKVGVMDTGISEEHPDLSYVEGYNFLDNNTDVDDENGHGTHVAGILAAGQVSNGMLGVAPNVELYVAKIMDEHGKGFESNMVKGIEWAIEKELDIVNLSVGSPNELPGLKLILEAGTKEGILFVGAAGNLDKETAEEMAVAYPARYPEVIAVGAVDGDDRRAFFSAYGAELEIVAPGVRIESTSTGTSYEYKSGTSMAAPYVTGMLAVMKEGHPSSSAKELRMMLRDPDWITPLGSSEHNNETGYGRINFAEEIPLGAEPLKPVQAINAALESVTVSEARVDVSWTAPDAEDASSFTYEVKRGDRVVYEGDDLAFTDRITVDGDYRYRIAVSDGNRTSEEAVSSEVQIRLLDPYAFLSERFSDLKESSWYNKPLALMVERELIGGYPDETIRPDAPITRGEVVTILNRHLGWPDDALADADTFTDVSSSYYAYEAIQKAAALEAVRGFEDGTFRANQHIMRADTVVILDRVFDYEVIQDPTTSLFPDVDLDAYYGTPVMNLVGGEIITGYRDGTFKPRRTITRAEFASLMQRTIQHQEQ